MRIRKVKGLSVAKWPQTSNSIVREGKKIYGPHKFSLNFLNHKFSKIPVKTDCEFYYSRHLSIVDWKFPYKVRHKRKLIKRTSSTLKCRSHRNRISTFPKLSQKLTYTIYILYAYIYFKIKLRSFKFGSVRFVQIHLHI